MAPSTRSASPRGPPRRHVSRLLDRLPDDEFIHTASLLLAADLRAALRLSQASPALLAQLGPVREQAAARRLRWLPAMPHARMQISGEGRTLTKHGADWWRWAAGPPCT